MAFVLHELLWTANELGVGGAKVIANVLERNRTLKTLDLMGRIQLCIGDNTKEQNN
jgi:hypothetical protein